MLILYLEARVRLRDAEHTRPPRKPARETQMRVLVRADGDDGRLRFIKLRVEDVRRLRQRALHVSHVRFAVEAIDGV